MVLTQLHDHLVVNLFEPFHSGFRKLHSTVTALVKVVNDLLLASDSSSLSSTLILLDLSSALDTVDHLLLLNHLESVFGVSGNALGIYFSGRNQFVLMDGFRSEVDPVCTDVPQGSVLYPLLFSIYIYPLGQLLRFLNFSYHFYADDTQIHPFFNWSNCGWG